MRFGYTLPNNWGITDIDGLVGLAPQAEEAGFSSLWVNHHVLNIGYVYDRLGDRPYYDALTVLTYAAARTSRVRLGTSVLVLSYLHPMTLAKQLATLDVFSGGRVIAGVGVGSLPEENDRLGVVAYDRRGAYADESIKVMRTLWDDDDPAFEGEFFRFDGVKASPKPAQARLPVVIGGNRRPALRRVARLADGWHPLGVSPDGLRERLVTLDEELAAAGRARADIEVSLRWDVRPDGDPAKLADRVAAYAEAGVAEIVFSVGAPELDVHRRMIDQLATLAH